MKKPLRVLIIEDSDEDKELVLLELRRGGYAPDYWCVDTREATINALEHHPWDIILSDYSMPTFDGLSALKLLFERKLDIPFILISGTIGEEIAVAAMKAGAHDYIMKNNLNRLNPAIERELKEAELHRLKKQAETALIESEKKLRHSEHNLLEAERIGKVGGWEFNIDTGKQTWTEEVYAIHEVDSSFEPTVENGIQFYSPLSRPVIEDAVNKSIKNGLPFDVELELITAKGNFRNVHAIGNVDLEQRRVYGFFQDITERKQIEEDLKKSEMRFRHISSTISDISYSCKSNQDEGYFIDWMTGAAEQITGYTIEEIKAKRCWGKLVVDEDAALFKEHVTGLAPGSSGTCELRVKQKGGNIIWVASFAECVNTTEMPETCYLYGGLVDITERKRIENNLRDSEEKFRNLFESINDAVMISEFTESGTPGKFIQVNDAACKRLGYTREELLSKTPLELNSERSRQHVLPKIKTIVAESHALIEAEHVSKEGNVIPVEISTTVAQLKGKKYFISIARDITERKRVEAEILESREFFKNIFEHSAVGKSITSLDGTLKTNKAFCEILGYTEDESLTINWVEITHPDDVGKNQQIIDSILSGEKFSERWEKRYIHKDGHIVFVDITTTLQRDGNGNPLYFITTIQDISKRTLAEQTLKKKMDELQKFQNLTIGRELAMIELKKEVNELLVKSGDKEKYKIVAGK